MKVVSLFAGVVLTLGVSFSSLAEEQIFSGPQVGEPLPPFSVQGVFGSDAGQQLDFVTQANGKPVVMVFVHDVNRLSIGMTRTLTEYTSSRAADGLITGVIWLNEDATEAENRLKTVQHALAPNAPVGIYTGGGEGPGSYGLNRNVMLTILVGKEGKVTANYALVQPSLQADLPKILESVVAVAGGRIPDLKELQGMQEMMQSKPGQVNLRPLLQPLIRKTATEEQVDKAAKALEERLAKDAGARREIARIANTIIDAGKLENYGTPHAQAYLKKWAKAYGKEKEAEAPAEKPAKSSDRN